jgi:hypothetical protein
VDPDPAFQENPDRHRFVADPDPTPCFEWCWYRWAELINWQIWCLQYIKGLQQDFQSIFRLFQVQ